MLRSHMAAGGIIGAWPPRGFGQRPRPSAHAQKEKIPGRARGPNPLPGLEKAPWAVEALGTAVEAGMGLAVEAFGKAVGELTTAVGLPGAMVGALRKAVGAMGISVGAHGKAVGELITPVGLLVAMVRALRKAVGALGNFGRSAWEQWSGSWESRCSLRNVRGLGKLVEALGKAVEETGIAIAPRLLGNCGRG